jgi:hypothetical protein
VLLFVPLGCFAGKLDLKGIPLAEKDGKGIDLHDIDFFLRGPESDRQNIFLPRFRTNSL